MIAAGLKTAARAACALLAPCVSPAAAAPDAESSAMF